MCGSTEAHALASKPIRYVLGDERDRWALSAGNEGDPWDLAMARQTTFYNAKSAEVSTPTVKNASAIEAAYATGTMERWKSRCPHCGEYHEIQWADIRFEHDEIIVAGKKTYKVRSVCYACPGCGCISTEAEMKRAPARWEADNPAAYEQGTRSFWLNAFVSQWASWESIILKYLNAIGSTPKYGSSTTPAWGGVEGPRGPPGRGGLTGGGGSTTRRGGGGGALSRRRPSKDGPTEGNMIAPPAPALVRPGALRRVSSWDGPTTMPYGRSWTSWYLTVFCALRTAWG